MRVTHRVSVRKDDSLLDIHVEVTIGDFEPIDKLAEIGVGDAGVLIGVRVLTENEGGNAVEVGRDETICEALREVEGVLALGDTKALGNVRRVGTEDSVRVNWTETQGLPRPHRLMGGDGGSRKASQKERNKQQLHSSQLV